MADKNNRIQISRLQIPLNSVFNLMFLSRLFLEESLLESPRDTRQRAMSEASDGRRSSQSSSIYPDTEDLLKVAQQMSDTRGRITQSAENVLESADGVGVLHC